VSTTARDRTLIVALAAAMWGLDGLLRKPLATALQPATVVLWEHLIAVLVLLPFAPRAVQVFLRCRPRDQVAVVVIGIGASAVATALFTEAFKLAAQTGDFITPLVLQKLQPLFAVAMALVLLGERLRPNFGLYAIPALIGAWLLTFAHPFDVSLSGAQAKVALLAIGAAVLWAAGTVLGRLVSPAVGARDLTTLRYLWGLVGAWLVLMTTHAPAAPGWSNATGLILLALIPGVIALSIYYYGLRATAASRATFAEMAFPATAAVVGVLFLHTDLAWSQWLGFAVIVAAITALGWHERTRRPAVEAPPVPAAATTR
jgi:drug/metabolite transporter, DME family